MADRHADAAPALRLDECRHKAVHVVEIGKAQEGGATYHLQSAAGVRHAIVQQCIPEPVCDSRRQSPQPVVPTRQAMPRDQLHTAVPGHRQQARNIRRIVLPVAVERRKPVAARDPSGLPERGALAGAPRMAQGTYSRVPGGPGQKQRPGPVDRAVVYHQHFVVDADQCRRDLIEERVQVLRLVPGRDDDGDDGRGAGHDGVGIAGTP